MEEGRGGEGRGNGVGEGRGGEERGNSVEEGREGERRGGKGRRGEGEGGEGRRGEERRGEGRACTIFTVVTCQIFITYFSLLPSPPPSLPSLLLPPFFPYSQYHSTCWL